MMVVIVKHHVGIFRYTEIDVSMYLKGVDEMFVYVYYSQALNNVEV